MNLTKSIFILTGLLLSASAENCEIEKLRLGHSYYFHNTFKAKEDTYIGEKSNWTFSEKNGDYNGGENPKFKETDWIKNKKFIVQKNEIGNIFKTFNPYQIKFTPIKRGKENLSIKYNIECFSKDNDGKWNKKSKWMNSCTKYEITWCGDGIKDNYIESNGRKINEECDPADLQKESWGTGGCSTSCTKIQIPKKFETCKNTFNRKLRVGYSYQFGDKFSNNTNISLHFNEYFMNFDETKNHGDFNAGKNPTIKFTKKFKNKNYILRPKESMSTAVIDKPYSVIHPPVSRSFDNLKIEYLAKYYEVKNNGKYVGPYFHSTCINYEITTCGDGIKDNYIESNGRKVNEECDDGNTKSGDGCSSTCQLEK